MPFVLMLALLGVVAVNVERHDSRTQQAADAAARAASLERTPADAEVAARTAAERVCQGVVVVDTPIRFVPPDLGTYTPGSVTVSLSCTETIRGTGSLVADPERTEAATAVAVIEYWREAVAGAGT